MEPPMSAMRLICFAASGSALINAATLVSSPMAMRVICPGLAMDLAAHKIDGAFLQNLRALEAIGPGGLVDVLLGP